MTASQLALDFSSLWKPEVGETYQSESGEVYVRIIPAKYMLNSTLIYEKAMSSCYIFGLSVDRFTFGVHHLEKIAKIS